MKHLKIEVLQTKWGKFLRVKEQTHREEEFGKNGDSFYTANRFVLISRVFPLVSIDRTQTFYVRGKDTSGDDIACAVPFFYVRGKDTSGDDIACAVPSESWLNSLRIAVREYNEYFSDEKKAAKEDEGDVEVIE